MLEQKKAIQKLDQGPQKICWEIEINSNVFIKQTMLYNQSVQTSNKWKIKKIRIYRNNVSSHINITLPQKHVI